ncbi:MAG: histidine phosphatase family protein [Chloroflexota bacterium]|nr:histidine phosphatase family protein [Chloroflexota bacterium]
MLTLYLVRHGWTSWHNQRRICGWSDVSLDRRGKREAQRTGQWFNDHLSGNPVVLLSSPVRRALQTAQILAGQFESVPTVLVDEGIAETRVPDWQGRLVDEIIANDPRWPDFYEGPATFRFPGGETGLEVQERSVAVVEGLRQSPGEQQVILVSHADPLRGIIAHYLGLAANHYYRLRIDCGSVSRLSLPGTDDKEQPSPPARLDFLNVTDHLKDEK